jgi:hypothetical protein
MAKENMFATVTLLAQLQRKEQAKDILIAMSRTLEVIALQFANEGWNNFYRLP